MTGLSVLVDVLTRHQTLSALSAKELRQYLASFLASVVLWLCAACVLSRFNRWLGRLLLALTLPAFFAQAATVVVFKRLPNDSSALFFANQWRFAVKTAALSNDLRAALVLGVSTALLGLFSVLAQRKAANVTASVFAILGAMVTTVAVATMKLSDSVPLLPDVNALRFVATVAQWGGSPPPYFSVVARRPQLSAHTPTPYNVLFIVYETVGASYLQTPAGREITPALLALKKDPAVVWFERMHAVSSCTDVSVPSIVSGVSPAADLATQMRAALLFDIAKSTGASTFVESSQSMTWASQDQYLDRANFERFHDLAYYDPKAEGDEGVPDEIAFSGALEDMDAAFEANRPFVGLLRTAGTHGPYRIDENDSPFSEDPGFQLGPAGGFARYLNALHRFDSKFDQFWHAAKKKPWFEKTLIVITADHGEAFGQHGLWAHCGAFFPEESWVPGAIRLPQAWRDANASREAQLRRNSTATTFTSALAPTVWAMLGWPAPLAQFDDLPLWESPLPSPVVFTNCTDFRNCLDVDFGILENGHRWVYLGNERRWLAFDEGSDPQARHDIAKQLNGHPREAINWLLASKRTQAVTARVLGDSLR